MIAGKSWIRNWINEHPAVWEFILFNVLSNVATIVNFIAMWICTGFLFVSLENIPFQFFVFHYTQVESDLGLGGFLSFLVATAAAQAVNFYVQKNFVFRSNAANATVAGTLNTIPKLPESPCIKAIPMLLELMI